MKYVYMIRSESNSDARYIGITSDLKSRLKAHNAKQSPHTAINCPWRLTTYIAFADEPKSRSLERKVLGINAYQVEKKVINSILVGIAAMLYFISSNCAYAKNTIDCNTSNLNSIIELGKDLFIDQKYSKAIETYTKILKCRPDNVLSLYNRGQAYMKLDNIHLAIQDYSKCIKILPNFISALERRAFAYFQTNRFNDSYADYETLLLKKPDDRNYLWGFFKSASG